MPHIKKCVKYRYLFLRENIWLLNLKIWYVMREERGERRDEIEDESEE